MSTKRVRSFTPRVRSFTPRVLSPERAALLHGCTRAGHDRVSCPRCTPPPDPWTLTSAQAREQGRLITNTRDHIKAAVRAEIAAGTYRGPLGSITRTVNL